MRMCCEGCSCILRGDIYSIPTYSTQSEKDTGDVSKGGGIVFEPPSSRYVVPPRFLKHGVERARPVLKYSTNVI